MASGGDANFYAMIAKAFTSQAWYAPNPDLGAPFGQVLWDYAAPDNVQFVLLKLIAIVTGEYGAVLNLYLLATFGLVALSAFYVCTYVGIRPSIAVVVATVFSFLPYHAFRGISHILLSGYYAVPLAVLLALWCSGAVGGSRRLTYFGSEHREMSRRTRIAWVVGLCVVVGSTGIYYASFAAVFVVVAVVLRQSREGWSRTGLVRGVFVIVVVAFVLVINVTPSLVFWATSGTESAVGGRGVVESELHGLKLTSVLLPRPDHRIGPVADKVETYQRVSRELGVPASEGGQAIGLIAVAGLSWLLASGVVGGKITAWLPDRERWINRQLFAFVVVALLIAAPSGLSVPLGWLGTSGLRSWNRIVVYLAFFSLLVVGLLLHWVYERMRRQVSRRLIAVQVGVGALVLMTAFGLFDQTSSADIPSYAAADREFRSDAAFVAEIEQRLPAGASVFQLPFMPFPEWGGIRAMADYDPIRGYLHSDDLKWSYGGTDRRSDDWQAALTTQAPFEFMPAALAAVGFDAIWVDSFGYDAEQIAEIRLRLGGVLGQEPIVSPDGRFIAYMLGEYSALQKELIPEGELNRIGAEILSPPTSSWEFGTPFVTEPILSAPGKFRYRAAAGKPVKLLIDNPLGPTEVIIDGVIESEGLVEFVEISTGSISEVVQVDGSTPFALELTIEPGETAVTFSAVGPETAGGFTVGGLRSDQFGLQMILNTTVLAEIESIAIAGAG